MSRVAQILNKGKLMTLAIPVVVIVGIVGAFTSHGAQPHSSSTVKNQASYPNCPFNDNGGQYYTNGPANQLTEINYDGIAGKTALDILKACANVQTKHYSFGDLVTSINGTAGNGPKYWSFYVNGKLSDVGASSYVTKSSDMIKWKLQ